MATKADFTEQEWDDLHRGASGSGMLVSMSDRSFFDTFKESGALAKALVDARTGGDSELVRELGALKGTGFGVSTPPQEVESGTLAALTSSIAVLQAKAPDEVEPYRAFVLNLATAVANAAKGGEEAEQATIARIRTALGIA